MQYLLASIAVMSVGIYTRYQLRQLSILIFRKNGDSFIAFSRDLHSNK